MNKLAEANLVPPRFIKPIGSPIIMKTEYKDIYDRLHKLYKKHLRRFKNPDSKQICCTWSTRNPPDEIYECSQMDDIQDEFNIRIIEKFDTLEEGGRFRYRLNTGDAVINFESLEKLMISSEQFDPL